MGPSGGGRHVRTVVSRDHNVACNKRTQSVPQRTAARKRHYCAYIFTARIRGMGRVLFSVCQFISCGVHHLHPVILPLLPCPFWGGGTPVLAGGYLNPCQGYPIPGQGVPQNRVRIRWHNTQTGQDGVPHSQERMGYSPSQERMGYPHDRLCLERLCCGR